MLFHVSEPYFSLIGQGLKTVEGRKNKPPFASLSIGDTITWYNDDIGFRRTVDTRVVAVAVYKTFKAYLQKERLSACLPVYGVNTMAQGVKVYRKFYSAEDERHYGVLAIRLEKRP
jgi:ASC-1-like (ASCH) protein